MKNSVFAILFFTFSGIIAVIVSLLYQGQVPFSPVIAKPVGLSLTAIGMIIVFWAARSLGGAFHGSIEPYHKKLIRSGPFRIVRHPVYLGFTVSFFGIMVITRSIFGLGALLILFIPSLIYRAKLEEEAMLEKFGGEWKEYVDKTSFFIPYIF